MAGEGCGLSAHSDEVQRQIDQLERHLAGPEYTPEDFARAERLLRQAFGLGPEESHSPAAQFAGGRPKQRDESLYRARRVPERYVDLGYPESLSTAGVWAARVHASESSRAKFSRPPIDAQSSSGWIVGIVNGLPEQHLLLIRAEFMRAGPMQQAFVDRLLREFWAAYEPRIAAGLQRGILLAMARCVVGFKGRPHRAHELLLRDQQQVTRANWSRRYVLHWRAMIDEYERAHRGALVAFLSAADNRGNC